MRPATPKPEAEAGGSDRITAVVGTALPLRGDDIDTDRIIPARYLRTVSFEGMERHVFEDDRKAARHPFDEPRFAGAAVLLVNRNFGCGSSREHAPQALRRWGIRAIIAESFSDIFLGNATMIGLPCVTAAHGAIAPFMATVEHRPELVVRVDLQTMQGEGAGFRFAIEMPPNAREAFLSGSWDTTSMLLERYDEVRAVAARLPYLSGFSQP